MYIIIFLFSALKDDWLSYICDIVILRMHVDYRHTYLVLYGERILAILHHRLRRFSHDLLQEPLAVYIWLLIFASPHYFPL